MDRYAELKTFLQHHIRSSVANLTEDQLARAVGVLLALRDSEIDRATLRSLGIVVFEDANALAKVDPLVVNPVVKEMLSVEQRQRDTAHPKKGKTAA